MRRLLAALALMTAACTTATVTTTTGPAPTTTAPIATTTTFADAGDDTSVEFDAEAVFEATGAGTFRSKTAVQVSRDPEGSDVVVRSTIDASYQRNPSAIQAAIVIEGQLAVEVIRIGETYWLNEGGAWRTDPLGEQVLELASVSVLAPSAVRRARPSLEDLGPEMVNGRPTTHYRGGAEQLAVILSVSGDERLAGFTTIDTATIDLWVEDAGFVVKADYEFGGIRQGAAAPEFYAATFELYDFDGGFTIEAPDTTVVGLPSPLDDWAGSLLDDLGYPWSIGAVNPGDLVAYLTFSLEPGARPVGELYVIRDQAWETSFSARWAAPGHDGLTAGEAVHAVCPGGHLIMSVDAAQSQALGAIAGILAGSGCSPAP
ncbi:MAG: hypothetical protein OEO77_10100 [Acidimicrobiia bacterium]|nr:hypothetical protein [Acidimicrobiia bacterium]